MSRSEDESWGAKSIWITAMVGMFLIGLVVALFGLFTLIAGIGILASSGNPAFLLLPLGFPFSVLAVVTAFRAGGWIMDKKVDKY